MIIRVKGVKRVVSKGTVYYYHRKARERINAEYGTIAFLQEVERLDKKVQGLQPEIKAGSLGQLIIAYKSDTNPEWKNLKPDTKLWYNRIFNYLKPLHNVLLVDLDTPYLMDVREKCFAKHKTRFTNGVISALSLMFTKMAIPKGWMKADPAAAVPTIRSKKKQSRRAWTMPEVKEMFGVLSGGMLVGVTLGYWCGLSLKDIVEFPRKLSPLGNGYDAEKRTLTYGRSKTDVGTTVPVSETAAVVLDAELARLADKDIQPATLVVNQDNKPFTRSGFQTNFQKLKGKLVKEGKVHPGLTLHGLRHTIGKDIIDQDGDETDVTAALAQDTSAMGRHYSKERDKARRAGKALGKVNEVREAALKS